jgi:hypothetical protein
MKISDVETPEFGQPMYDFSIVFLQVAVWVFLMFGIFILAFVCLLIGWVS